MPKTQKQVEKELDSLVDSSNRITINFFIGSPIEDCYLYEFIEKQSTKNTKA